MFSVAFCGIDGSGKTTAINILKNKLNEFSDSVVVAKCPFETKRLLYESGIGLHGDFKTIEIKRIAMAFEYVEYCNHVLQQGRDIVLFDRYTICYQLLDRLDRIPLDTQNILSKIYKVVPSPDLFVFCTINPRDALERLINRGNYDKDEENINILIQLNSWYMEYFDKLSIPTIKISPNTMADLEIEMNKVDNYIRSKLL